jgi:hypothetical protein
MLSTTGDAWIKAQVFIRVGVNTSAVGRIRTRRFARTKPPGRTGYPFRLVADPFKAFRAVFAPAKAKKRKRCFINGAYRRTIRVKVSMAAGRITLVQGDSHPVKMELVTKHFVGIIGIKRRIAKKSFIGKRRVGFKKVIQHRFKGEGITYFLINIRVVSFFRNNFRMPELKIIIKKNDATDYA